MKTIGLLVCGLVLGFAHNAAASADEPNYRPLTIGVDAGTTGLGGSASWRFSDNFGIRGGVNYFSYDTDEFTYTTRAPGLSPNVDQKFNTTLRLLSEPVAIDYYPSAKSAFHISFGILINQNRFNANVKDDNSGSAFIINGIQYLQFGVKELDLEVKQQPISPYLSIGTSFYFGESKRWALSGELGVAYTGSPKVSLTAPNHDPALDSNPDFSNDLEAEEESIKKDAEDYQFYPIVKIGVSYSF